MTRAEAWFAHAVNALVGGTGLVYGWMRYFAEPADELSAVNHPLQPALQGLHILLAPLLVFATALLWREHAWRRLRSGHAERRRSGLVLLAVFGLMVASGYLLQVAVSERAHAVWIALHVSSSCLWLLAYLVHQLARRPQEDHAPGVRGNSGPALARTASRSRPA